MPTSLSPSIFKWNGQTKIFRNFIKIVKQLFKILEITDNFQNLKGVSRANF